MLSEKTVQVIKFTVPTLEVHGTAITKRFYEMMFANHPELLNLFNHANQKQGRQQTALANAVYESRVSGRRCSRIRALPGLQLLSTI